MLRAHPWTAATLAIAIVGVLVFGSAAGAQAAIWPKGFNPKQYMLNVLGSMLAGTNPDGKLGTAKRAVIQADQQYDHSWEGLNESWKKSASNVPDSYEDYVIQRQEYFNQKGIKGVQGQQGTPDNTGKGTKYVKPMKAPATKIKKFTRAGVGAGLGLGASVGWAYRADLGTAVSGLFGIDAENAVCSDRDSLGNFAPAVDFITGQDCEAWAIDKQSGFVPNADAKGEATLAFCMDDGFCANYEGISSSFSSEVNLYCWAVKWPGNDGRSHAFQWVLKKADGNLTYPLAFPTNQRHPNDTKTQNYCSPASTFSDSYQRDWELVGATGKQLQDGSTDYTSVVRGTTDPDRTFRCTYVLEDGSEVQKETDTFKQTDDDVPSPVCPAIDPGDQAVKDVKVDEVNKETGQATSVYDSPTTEEYRDWYQKYPECREGACALDLIKNSESLSCFASDRMNDACLDWMRDPNKAASYQCMYGGHKVDLSECYVYADVFNPQKVLDGTAYADPATGESVSGQSNPKAAQKALGREWTDPQDFRGCLDDGWAKVNPIEWVMIPVQCSLQWAFAPSTQVTMTTVNKAQNDWASKAPGKIANAVTGWSITAPAGCDIPVTVMGTHMNLAPACPGQPLAGVAAISKVATTAVVAVLAFFACRRIVRSWIGDNDSNDGGGDR